jgi:hypothetical protein
MELPLSAYGRTFHRQMTKVDMTLDEFENPSPPLSGQPDSRTRSRDCGGTPVAMGETQLNGREGTREAIPNHQDGKGLVALPGIEPGFED